MSRALRRHHRRRIIAKHARLYREVYYWFPPALDALPHQMRLRNPSAPHKLDQIDRRRAERGWREIEEVAW